MLNSSGLLASSKSYPKQESTPGNFFVGEVLYRSFAANDPRWHRGCSGDDEKIASGGRILQTDIVTQRPDLTLSYNRYAYVWNNPMNLIDPSGYMGEGEGAEGEDHGDEDAPGFSSTDDSLAGEDNLPGKADPEKQVDPSQTKTTDKNLVNKDDIAIAAVPGRLALTAAALGLVKAGKALINGLKGLFGKSKGKNASDSSKQPQTKKDEIDPLLKAGKQLDKNNLTKAGRALQKHGDRKDSVFPKSAGNADQRNVQGQEVLENILKSKDKTTKSNRFGGKDIYDNSTGRGARFDSSGNVKGFLEP